MCASWAHPLRARAMRPGVPVGMRRMPERGHQQTHAAALGALLRQAGLWWGSRAEARRTRARAHPRLSGAYVTFCGPCAIGELAGKLPPKSAWCVGLQRLRVPICARRTHRSHAALTPRCCAHSFAGNCCAAGWAYVGLQILAGFVGGACASSLRQPVSRTWLIRRPCAQAFRSGCSSIISTGRTYAAWPACPRTALRCPRVLGPASLLRPRTVASPPAG